MMNGHASMMRRRYMIILSKKTKKVMAAAIDHFPATSLFKELFGEYGNSSSSKLLIETGKVPNDIRLTNEIREMLISMKRKSGLTNNDVITSEITGDEYQDFFKNTKESTSSSPSGIHIGHYKATIEIPDMCDSHAIMMTIPFQYQFSPLRWKSSIHCMIEKVKGSPKNDKLRIIQLIEADFNAALKIKISKQLMALAEKHVLLGTQMHGGRRNKGTSDALLTQRLAYDISQQSHIPMVTLNLDATKCYDRIFPNFATLTLGRLGVPLEFGATIAETLKNKTQSKNRSYTTGYSCNMERSWTRECSSRTSMDICRGIYAQLFYDDD